MSVLIVNGITKYFEQDRIILDKISFKADEGERIGLLGGNGAGKTTLLRVIAGEIVPDAGSFALASFRRVGYISQMTSFGGSVTVDDALHSAVAEALDAARGMEALTYRMGAAPDRGLLRQYADLSAALEAEGGYGWETRIDKVASGLSVTRGMRGRPFASLSGGEQTRVCLAGVLLREPDILLLDEPTNHLDIAAVSWLEEWLQHFRGTALIVSHDRFFLDNTIGRVIELDRGGLSFYSGNYSAYVREKEARIMVQQGQYDKEQAKIAQLTAAARRMHTWAQAYDNPALHKRAKAMEKRAERTRTTDKPGSDRKLSHKFGEEEFKADQALVINGLAKAFDDKKLFADVTLTIRGGGERIALMGANGSGKTTFLKVLLGMENADAGSFRFGPSVRVGYLPQEIVFEHPGLTLLDTLQYEQGCTIQEARGRLGGFRFSSEDVFKSVSDLSGGERARLKLCLLMAEKVNMLVLDEPTNHLDLASREWIEEAVESFGGTLLFVSHDRYFIRRFARRIWELDGSRLLDLPYGYDEYLALKKPAPPPQVKAPPPALVKAKDAAPAIRRRLAALEQDIAFREAELRHLEEIAAQFASDYMKLGELDAAKKAKQSETDALFAQWEAVALQLRKAECAPLGRGGITPAAK
jgi:ATP-binding cassette, subfamily F, member 3